MLCLNQNHRLSIYFEVNRYTNISILLKVVILQGLSSRNVSVIGAGTAGLIAARELAQAGISTTVYDQKRVLGYPVRASGIVSINGLRSIGVDYKSAVTNTLYGARLHAGKSTIEIDAKSPMAHVVERMRFNELCREQAEKAGAGVVLGRRITPELLSGIRSKGDITVGADGAVSTVAKHYNMGELGDHVLTYKAEYEVESSRPDTVDLFFDKEYKGLFGWLCPNSRSVLEVGIGVSPGRYNARRAFESFVRRHEIKDMVEGRKMLDGQASIIPMRLRRRIVDLGNRVLLVGDAAGQVKPSTGGGIVFGGNAAVIAAKTIRRHLLHGTSLREYEKFYKKRYGPDTALHFLVNRLYSGMGGRGAEFGIRAMRFMGLSSLLGRYGDMDSPTRLIANVAMRRRARVDY